MEVIKELFRGVFAAGLRMVFLLVDETCAAGAFLSLSLSEGFLFHGGGEIGRCGYFVAGYSEIGEWGLSFCCFSVARVWVR